METIKKNLEEKSKKSIAVLKEDLNTVRAGRANPALLDKVMVDYYGSPTPLKNLANVSVPDPRTLLITPFDPKAIGEIDRHKSIQRRKMRQTGHSSGYRREKKRVDKDCKEDGRRRQDSRKKLKARR